MVKSGFTVGVVLLLAIWFAGCGEPEKVETEAFIIKTPVMEVSRNEFSDELDLKLTAYPYDIDENPAEYNEMVIHLVETLSDELVLLSAASERGLLVTKQEVDSAEAEFRKDYPEDSFEQMLLKNAITYGFWKKRFERNMIMEKLIDEQLSGSVEITSRDIVAFYETLKVQELQSPAGASGDGKPVESETELVGRLRLKKTQEAYEKWVKTLWEQYPVEINNNELKRFLISLENSRGSKK